MKNAKVILGLIVSSISHLPCYSAVVTLSPSVDLRRGYISSSCNLTINDDEDAIVKYDRNLKKFKDLVVDILDENDSNCIGNVDISLVKSISQCKDDGEVLNLDEDIIKNIAIFSYNKHKRIRLVFNVLNQAEREINCTGLILLNVKPAV